jgi:hypothetical protein
MAKDPFVSTVSGCQVIQCIALDQAERVVELSWPI